MKGTYSCWHQGVGNFSCSENFTGKENMLLGKDKKIINRKCSHSGNTDKVEKSML